MSSHLKWLFKVVLKHTLQTTDRDKLEPGVVCWIGKYLFQKSICLHTFWGIYV